MSLPVSSDGAEVAEMERTTSEGLIQVDKMTENGTHGENTDGETEVKTDDDNVAVNGADDEGDRIGKEQYMELYRECMSVQLQNEKYSEKLYRIRKVTRRLQKERKFLMKKLDGFGDDYRNAKIKFMEEEVSRIANEAQDDEDDDVTTKPQKKPFKKKLKVKRLHNAPKKPSNAFLMFCQKNRSVVQEEHQKLNKNEIGRQEMTRRLAEIWKVTSTENKKEYYEMYEQDKVRYAQEMKKFESENPVKEEIETTSTSNPTTVPNSLPQNTASET